MALIPLAPFSQPWEKGELNASDEEGKKEGRMVNTYLHLWLHQATCGYR